MGDRMEEDRTSNQLTPLDKKVEELMRDRIILKTLTRWNDAYKEFPRFVMEYLVARFVDPLNPVVGQAKIDRILTENWVDSSAKELIKSRIKELFGLARKRGRALGICHPTEATVEALKKNLALADGYNVELVFASQVVHK